MTTPQVLPGTVRAVEPAHELAPRFHLILLDDDEHTYQYVIEMLGDILGYGVEKSFVLARVVDTQGRAIVETAGADTVLDHQRAIHQYGADPRMPACKGSMSAVIEPAP
jgi:ATP-dependent Clp protease adaptor protein ClpS